MLSTRIRPASVAGAVVAVAVAVTAVAVGSTTGSASHSPSTTTPIKHVVVIIGENHSFDNVFATYRPPGHQKVWNLLSEGIVTRNGTPGPSFGRAAQLTASDTLAFTLTPKVTGEYPALPAPNTTYVSSACDGQPGDAADTRFPANLPDGPYQITKYVPYFDSHSEYASFGQCEFYGAYVGDPQHRFYQMWQQTAAHQGRLGTWVASTAGDDNGTSPPAPIYQGSVQEGFYNMAQGDAPVLRDLAENYAISDNYHQAVQGGTGANHIALGTGFAASYQDTSGHAAVPPANQIDNPNPKPGTNNNYSQDGYSGGSYSECADPSQPGVGAIDKFLATLPYKPLANCQPGRYYILNNYHPGYNVDGTLNTATYTVPPQKSDYATIGDALSAHHISWGYYGEGYDNGQVDSSYCGICDPMQYSASIMTNPSLRANVQHGLGDFVSAAADGTLPAVSFLKPGGDDGHPRYSTLEAFENFVARAVAAVQGNPSLWRNTAIFVTFDETGGYYDSGYTQPVSFFGDGPRVPLFVVSPFARRGFVDHTYNDHVSVLKFIEANWKLNPLSSVSEDNLPNATPGVYVPRDRPAIGNLMTLFDFSHPNFATLHLSPPGLAAPRGHRLGLMAGWRSFRH
ncbi:MAG TPA: alkaline phosphatase family protein [Streptosporangiaceae bacterium]|nr:alkaline phosphatase family protein [Streptosporangiaceae bacterium]